MGQTESLPTATAEPLAFVGRARELSALRDALERTMSGTGSVVTLAGAAGIGKTRTAREFAISARQAGAIVLHGACYEGQWAPPYGPFVEAFTAYVRSAEPSILRDDLGFGAAPIARVINVVRERLPDTPQPESLQPDEERLRLFDAFGEFVRTTSLRHPLVLILDDLHWAEGGTIALLRYLARFAPEQRLLIVGTYRDLEPDADHPLNDLLGSFRRESMYERILLKGITPGEGADLIVRLAARDVPETLVAAINRCAQGNPFFIREIVQHLAEEGALGNETLDLSAVGVPEGIRHVVGRRVSRLSAATSQLLTVASNFTRPFRLDVAALVAGLDLSHGLEAIDEALRARLIEPTAHADTYAFAHALIQHTLFDALSPSRRTRLHRQIAAALVSTCGAGPGEHSGEVAMQYYHSRDLAGAQEGVDHALAAADRAASAYAHEDVATMLQIALELLPEHDSRRPLLLGRRGIALTWSLDFEQAGRACLEAAEAIAAEQPGTAASYLTEAITAMDEVGDYSGSGRLARRGLELIGDRRDATWALLMSVDLLRREAEDPDHPGIALDTPERREVWNVLSKVYREGGTGPAAAFMMLDGGGILDSSSSVVGPLMTSNDERAKTFEQGRLRASFSTGRYREGIAIWSEVAEASERQGRLARAIGAWSTIARFHTALGEFADGRSAYRRGLALAKRLPRSIVDVAMLVAAEDEWRMARDTDWGQPMEGIPSIGDGGTTTFVLYRASTQASVARIHARMGRSAKALRRLATVISAIDRAAVWAENYVRLCCDAAETLWLSRSLNDAGTVERSIREKIIANDYHYPMCDGRLALARLCALGERYGEALDWFARARTLLDTQGARPLRAIVDYDEGLMYVRRADAGDADRAIPLLEAAFRQFRALDMPGWMRRAEHVLQHGTEWLASDPDAKVPAPALRVAASRDSPALHPREPDESAVFRKSGDFWVIAFGGHSCQLRDMRGLHYLVILLRHPDREFHATELVRLASGADQGGPNLSDGDLVQGRRRDLGDAGFLLDAQSAAAYHARLRELRDELAEAEAFNDIGRAERARTEIAFLTDELAAAGRGKRASSHAERARITVTKGIRSALVKLERANSMLGKHLRATVKRGYFCRYTPDPRYSVAWHT